MMLRCRIPASTRAARLQAFARLLALVGCIASADSSAQSETIAAREVHPRGELTEAELETIEIFERTSPSVVYITTVQTVRDFWTRNVMRVPRGTGSGFLWDEQGHVVTNFHVLRGAQGAYIRLADQRQFPAGLVGVSPDHDLAVLKIDADAALPPPVRIGSSEDLRVGQHVLAIGNPFGLDYTLTTGIISALNRSIDNELGGVIENLIQTDAAINPGNSGGPLLDSAGRVIGINTAIFSPSGAYAGIGFAVPIDTVNRIVPSLIAFGRYVRPSLGISLNDAISRRYLRPLDLDGVLILGVAPGSPAERAGVRGTQSVDNGAIVLGDVLQAVDGEPVTSAGDLAAELDRHAVGDVVTLTLWRDERTREVDVQLTR